MKKSDLAKTYRILAGDIETTAMLTKENSEDRFQTFSEFLEYFAEKMIDCADVLEAEILKGEE